jgi:hypothetical protein
MLTAPLWDVTENPQVVGISTAEISLIGLFSVKKNE